MRKLISMTDYVLKQNPQKVVNSRNLAFIRCEKYANFLKLPLTLGMFIPTDENGNVLEESGMFKLLGEVENDVEQQEYKQAQDRVIFEGFENIELIEKLISLNETIEILDDLGITITETAVKKYGL